MKTPRAIAHPSRAGALLLGLVLTAGCAPKGVRRQTDAMEKSGAVGVSDPEEKGAHKAEKAERGEKAAKEGRDEKEEKTPAPDAPPSSSSNGETQVAWEVALVRDAPKTGAVVARLPRGAKVKPVTTKDGWYQIKFGEGFATEGWVYRGAIGR